MQTLFVLNEETENCWNLTEGMSLMIEWPTLGVLGYLMEL